MSQDNGHEPSRIIKPGEVQIPLVPVKILDGKQLQINLEIGGRKVVLIIKPVDYHWINDEYDIQIGHKDITDINQQGKILLP